MTPIRTCMLARNAFQTSLAGSCFNSRSKIGRGLRESLLRQDQVHAPIAGLRSQNRIGGILIALCFIVQHGYYVEKSPGILRVLGGNTLADLKGLLEERDRLCILSQSLEGVCLLAQQHVAQPHRRKGCPVRPWAAHRHAARQA